MKVTSKDIENLLKVTLQISGIALRQSGPDCKIPKELIKELRKRVLDILTVFSNQIESPIQITVQDSLTLTLEKTMRFAKITEGHVIQLFDDTGKFLRQKFVAGDQCEYETEDGDPINVSNMPLAGREYHPFTMQNVNE